SFVPSNGKYFYSMTVSPLNNDIFVADALDYQQPGVIYRYSADGSLIGHFEAGLIPTAYAWVIE
ncbi:MAG: YncE family protein, partial [Muribaculaceae bacterium]|nr:YncE family protein [Muribaculaceae bacterium]